MYPILFQWGALVLPSWHVFYALGALVGYAVLLFLRQRFKSQVGREELSHLFLICYIVGYFGARFLSIIVEEPHISGFANILGAVFRFGPMTFYGGAIAAFCFGSAYCFMRKMRFAEMSDLGIPAGLIALSIGRIGCFLNGDDYGKAVGLDSIGRPPLWSVVFPALQDGVPRWPVQLFESLGTFIFVFFLIWLRSTARPTIRPGMVGFLGIVFYANFRFGLEFLRDDFRGFVFGSWLSTSQFIALATLFVAGVVAPFWLSRNAASLHGK